MFRGSLWLQRHGRDWTLAAFLSTGKPTSAAGLRQALTDPGWLFWPAPHHGWRRLAWSHMKRQACLK